MVPGISEELTRKGVERALEISGTRVDRLARQGRLKYRVTPLGRLFDPESVEAYRRAQERREQEREG